MNGLLSIREELQTYSVCSHSRFQTMPGASGGSSEGVRGSGSSGWRGGGAYRQFPVSPPDGLLSDSNYVGNSRVTMAMISIPVNSPYALRSHASGHQHKMCKDYQNQSNRRLLLGCMPLLSQRLEWRGHRGNICSTHVCLEATHYP